jgi:hypothetical protein
MARLIAWILRHPERGPLTILNVAGRGDAIDLQRCAGIAGQRIRRLPGRHACRAVLQLLWSMGLSGFPPDSLPYLLGSCTVDTSRLQAFLGSDYEQIIKFTAEEALRDSVS